MSAAEGALRAIMDAIEIDTVAEVSAVHFTPVGLADLAGALADLIEAARAEGEAAGRAAERERIAAWLQAHSGGAPSGLWDAYALTLMASRIRAGDVVPDIGAGAHVGALRTAP